MLDYPIAYPQRDWSYMLQRDCTWGSLDGETLGTTKDRDGILNTRALIQSLNTEEAHASTLPAVL